MKENKTVHNGIELVVNEIAILPSDNPELAGHYTNEKILVVPNDIDQEKADKLVATGNFRWVNA